MNKVLGICQLINPIRILFWMYISWLNGREMCDIHDKQIGAGEGFIAFQIHHDGETKVCWKNIRIKELK